MTQTLYAHMNKRNKKEKKKKKDRNRVGGLAQESLLLASPWQGFPQQEYLTGCHRLTVTP
jgi:hypothetical protein